MSKEQMKREEFERIEKYLTGTMDKEEELEFKQELDENQDLREKTTELAAIMEGVHHSIAKEELDNFHRAITEREDISLKTTTEKQPGLRSIWWVAAASLVLLVAAVFFLNRPGSEKSLYTKYFQPDPGLPTVMGGENEYEFYNAMVDYKQGNYEEAIKKWTTLYKNGEKSDTLSYFLGVAHLANEDTQTAIPYLEEVRIEKESIFREDAHYYLALAYLEQGKEKEAKELLNESERESAKNILNELE